MEAHDSKFKHFNKDSLKNKSIATTLENLRKKLYCCTSCKRFQAQTLLQELGLTTNITSKRYTMVNSMSELDIINNHSRHVYNFSKTSLG